MQNGPPTHPKPAHVRPRSNTRTMEVKNF